MKPQEMNVKIAKALGYELRLIGESLFGAVYHEYSIEIMPFTDIAVRAFRKDVPRETVYYGMVQSCLPNWADDINATLRLIETTCRIWTVMRDEINFRTQVMLKSSPGEYWISEGDTLPMALCTAWLKAKENENPYGAKAILNAPAT